MSYSSASLSDPSAPLPTGNATGERADAIRSKIARYRRVVVAYWWIPAITISVGLAAQAWLSLTSPISYQSYGRILVSGRITLPESGMFNEEAVNFFGKVGFWYGSNLFVNNEAFYKK